MKLLVAYCTLLMTTLAAMTANADNGSNLPFRVGEKLTYQIFWGPFVAGRATMEVQDIQALKGHDCYHLVTKVSTSGLADMMYPMQSTFESWLDVNNMCVRRCLTNRSENKKIRRTETNYDYDLKTVIYTNQVNGKTRKQTLDPVTQDPISSFYYARSQSLSISNSFSFPINTGDTKVTCTLMPDERKNYSLRSVGEVSALRIEPKPTLNIVSKNGGRMWFWVSDDERKLPLVVVSTLKFGSIKLVLNKVESITPSTTRLAAATPVGNRTTAIR